jgi:hypothetical protein
MSVTRQLGHGLQHQDSQKFAIIQVGNGLANLGWLIQNNTAPTAAQK